MKSVSRIARNEVDTPPTIRKLKEIGIEIQDELKKGFVSTIQGLIVQKKAVFAARYAAIAETLDTAEFDRVAVKRQDQALGMAERARKLAGENARVRRGQEEYQREYNGLAAEYEKRSEKIRAIAGRRRDKEERRRGIEILLHMMENQNEYARFNLYIFAALADKAVVGRMMGNLNSSSEMG